MRKRFQIILLFFLTVKVISGQDIKNITGKYSYSFNKESSWYYESIQFNADSQFVYECNRPFLRERILGKWRLIGNKIVLNSNIKREKIIVTETTEDRSIKNSICVYDKQKEPINYKLFVINTLNDTIEVDDQWECSLIQDSIRSFYIVDSKGLVSPKYLVKNKKSNKFYVLFETQRMFDNEVWLFQGDSIIPKDSQGNYQNYYLKLSSSGVMDIK
jgi:hypothetical protein